MIAEGDLGRAVLNDLVQIIPGSDAKAPRSLSNIFVDGTGQANWQRKNHANTPAQCVRVAQVSHAVAVNQHLAAKASAVHQIQGAVDGLEQRGFARIGGANDAQGAVARDAKTDLVQDLLGSIKR